MATGKQRLAMMLSLIDDSLEKRLELAKDMKEGTRLYLDNLREMAAGIWFERTEFYKNGSSQKRIYQKAPSLEAIKVLMQYANYDPSVNTNMLLEGARAEAALAQRLLIGSQRNLNVAQKRLTDRTRLAQDRSQIDESLVNDIILELAGALIRILQAIDPDDLGGETRKQELLEKIEREIEMVKKELLARSEESTLPATFVPRLRESDDEEDDDE